MTNALVLAADAIQEVPEAPAPAISRKHVKSLDGVRGLAILVVLVHHLTSSCWPSAHPSVHHLRDILYMGWAGVDLFFVLSGFLITGILMDTKSADNYFQAFYMRRVLRIFPLFYLVLTALTLAYYAPFGWHMVPFFPPPKQQPFYFVYLNNWLPLHRGQPNIIGHFWTLAVEEQFYLLWPLCVWLLPRKKILPVAAAGVLIGFCLRSIVLLYFESFRHQPMPDLLENLFFRGLDTLLAGAAIAALVRDPKALLRFRRRIYLVGILSGLLAFLMLYIDRPRDMFYLIGFTLLGAAFGALVLFVFNTADKSTPFQNVMRSAPLTSFGKYSYGIYVYHVPVLGVGLALLSSKFPIGVATVPSLLFMLGVLVCSYAIAVLSYSLFEQRILSLKSRYTAKMKRV